MNTTQPKPFVFVLMPFLESFNDIYEAGIKQACKDAGAYCERVDEQVFEESILERIYNQINKADIIVSDMTGRNPNVFYETGYAHALGKRVILLTQKSEDIPFDLKHYPHIIYEGKITTLKNELEKRIKWYIENPTEPITKAEPNLEVYVSGKLLKDKPLITTDIISMKNSEVGIDISFDIHNPSKIKDDGNYAICLLAPPAFPSNDNYQRVSIHPDGMYIHYIDYGHSIFPGGWISSPIELVAYNKEELLRSGGEFEFQLNLYTEFGTKEYPFTVSVQPANYE